MVYVSPHATTDQGDQRTGGTRICRGCQVRQPVERFHWANGRTCRRRKCMGCTDVMQAAARAAKPELYRRSARAKALRIKYGLTIEQFDAMLIAQSGRCGICSEPLHPDLIHVDHDHKNGHVRGLLCFTCNTALGKFHDDVVILQAAIDYLTDAVWRLAAVA